MLFLLGSLQNFKKIFRYSSNIGRNIKVDILLLSFRQWNSKQTTVGYFNGILYAFFPPFAFILMLFELLYILSVLHSHVSLKLCSLTDDASVSERFATSSLTEFSFTHFGFTHSQTWHVIEILLHSDHAYRIYVGETFFKCFRSMRLLCINIYKTKIVSIWKFFSRCCWMYCIVCCCCPLLSKMSVLSVVTFDWKLKEKLEKQEKIQRNKCVERINSKKKQIKYDAYIWL